MNSIAAVEGFSTNAQVRLVAYQSGRLIHAPANSFGFQPLDPTLTAIAGLVGAANKGIYFTGVDAAALFDLTAAGRALLDDVDAAAQRTTLGLGSIATQNANNVAITGGSIAGITDLAIADGGTGASTAAAALTNLGITFGTWAPTLTSIANVDSATANLSSYLRVGNLVVLCWGSLAVDPTAAANTATQLGISLPVASNLSTGLELAGAAVPATAQRAARILGDATNDRAVMFFASEVTASTTFTFIFGYPII